MHSTQNSDHIASITAYTAAMLLTSDRNSIRGVRGALCDSQAALLSELSLINNEISKAIQFNLNLIQIEYVDYLISKVREMDSITTSGENAKKLYELSSAIVNSSKIVDGKFADNLTFVNGKISNILKKDILTSAELSPIATSKTTDFILSVRDRINELNTKIQKIRERIDESDKIIESSDFCLFLLDYKFDGDAYIMEENYETIINFLTAEYIKWKGGV